jgi:hypothetical protein
MLSKQVLCGDVALISGQVPIIFYTSPILLNPHPIEQAKAGKG